MGVLALDTVLDAGVAGLMVARPILVFAAEPALAQRLNMIESTENVARDVPAATVLVGAACHAR